MQDALKLAGLIQSAEVITLAQKIEAERRSVVDVLADALRHLAFQTAEEVSAYVREERDAWKRG